MPAAENDAGITAAETLSRAAALMREAWTDAAKTAAEFRERGEAVGTFAPTMLAVADWLDCELLQADVAYGSNSAEAQHALSVARAYLGERP